uniref:BTB domain-containing protein n=1 Tax=Cacopsylla melanoneura TaxID=428564 RepID=A0A8D9BVN3_9HEMI
MAEGEGVYNDNIHVLKKVMGLMLNNQKFSDAVFSVKDQQFFVLSHLLAASSTIFDTMMSSHYEHCNDKDMKIYNTKHEDSFLLILIYIYGQSVDFHTTPVHVICEVLCLAEKYQLSEFYNDLKRFLRSFIDTYGNFLHYFIDRYVSNLYGLWTPWSIQNALIFHFPTVLATKKRKISNFYSLVFIFEC